MSETEVNKHLLPMSPHQPSPSSSSPEIYNRYHPKVVKRMQADECFKCKQIGHWSWDCPLKSPNGKSLSPSVNSGSSTPVRIWCRCGHGLCEEKIALNDRNYGKRYFACPIKRGKKCKDFVKWCDGGNIDESDLRPPPYKYPECVCGAGVCRKEKGTGRPYGSEYYFTCPIPENHGSCGYRVWEDELLDNNKGIVPIQESSQRTHALLEVHQNEQTDCDLSKGGDLLLENSKSMRVMGKSENLSSAVGEDELLDNNKDIVSTPQSSQRTHVLMEVHQNEETDYDMGKGGDLLLENSKSMRVMDKSENLSSAVGEDELLDNNKDIVSTPQSSQRTHVLMEVHQNEETDYDMGKGGDSLLEHSKSIRVMDNFGNPSLVAVSELLDREDGASPEAAPSKCVGFSDFEVADYLQDLEYANSVPWEAIKEEPTPSRNCGRHSLFQGHIFGPCNQLLKVVVLFFLVLAISRHLFFYPTQSLKFPPPQRVFTCVSPSSFNPIGDVPCERSQLADNSLSQPTQISTGYDNDVSRDAVTPNKSPASERKLMSKGERQRQMVMVAQQQLLIDLETFDPNEQREAAEATFDMLDNLGVKYEQFAEHVWDYIESMAEIDKSMENSLTLDEYNKRLEEEKVRFARIQDDCFNTKTLLEASNQQRLSLIEEISHLEAMLNEKQTHLKSCELENLQIETHLGELGRSLVEAEKTLKVTAEEAKIARQLNEESKNSKQISAKTALEKAKLELEN